jgi:HPr kinase/phosphorylase
MKTTLEIQSLYEALKNKLGLGWITGNAFKNKLVYPDRDASQHMSLVGHLNLITQHCVQVLGRKELEYLDALKKNSRKDTISQLFSDHTTLVIIAKGLPAPADMEAAAIASQTPILSSTLPSQDVVEILQHHLTNLFADKITLHGVFMEVLGTGVLITGDSSIGKSELALELLTRGHRLIADDATEFARVFPDTLLGTCPEMLQDFLEVRGLGILNVRAMFGASAIKQHRNLRLIVVLQDIEEAAQMDRLHGSRQLRKIQDVNIPEITLPVGPGRNLAVLLEVAVRNHLLNAKGYDASQAFIDRQKRRLESARQ